MNKDDFLENYYDIVCQMSSFHELFYKLAAVGKPVLSDEVPTAAVGFDKEGRQILYVFNPDFIESLTPYEIKFVMCHEMLHILYNHGSRTNHDDPLSAMVSNIAQDIVINHALLESFYFNRYLLSNLNELGVDDSKKGKEKKDAEDKGGICFVDTVFSKEEIKNIQYRETYEYYFNKLVKKSEGDFAQFLAIGNNGSLDDHSGLPSISKDELKEALEDAVGEESAEKIMEELEKGAGVGNSGQLFNTIYEFKKGKKKFESVLHGFRKTLKGLELRDSVSWERTSRRMALIENSNDFIVPSMMEKEDHEGRKFNVHVFQDVSGSCYDSVQRFLNISRLIDAEKCLKVTYHTFDTRVRRFDINCNQIPGGGGTRFDIIENFIQTAVSKGERYPDVVFVVTDGMGNGVYPKYPERWNWLLSMDYLHYIPAKSKVYTTDEFE